MKILIAPDSFKGSVSSRRFCQIAESALMEIDKSSQVVQIPMADGGEGTVEALVLNTGGQLFSKEVSGPLGDKVRADYGILGDGETAVIEMAAASGITLLDAKGLNPKKTSTYGTGELVADALQRGCIKLIMGIGGSATNDCGMGMLEALGFRFYDETGNLLRGCGENLGKVKKIDVSTAKFDFSEVECLVACDVDNPLCGERGATCTYGRQKGATADDLRELEAGMVAYNEVVTKLIGKDISEVAGAGAAGGLGAGLITFLNGKLSQGFSIISQEIGLEKTIATGGFDLIITGEGRMDWQTAYGKLPMGIAGLGKKYGVPVIAVVGSVEGDVSSFYDLGFCGIYSTICKVGSLDEIFANAEENLRFTLSNIFRTVQAFKK